MAKAVGTSIVARGQYLDDLPVLFAEHVDAHHSLVEVGVGGLDDVIVGMLLEQQ